MEGSWSREVNREGGENRSCLNDFKGRTDGMD